MQDARSFLFLLLAFSILVGISGCDSGPVEAPSQLTNPDIPSVNDHPWGPGETWQLDLTEADTSGLNAELLYRVLGSSEIDGQPVFLLNRTIREDGTATSSRVYFVKPDYTVVSGLGGPLGRLRPPRMSKGTTFRPILGVREARVLQAGKVDVLSGEYRGHKIKYDYGGGGSRYDLSKPGDQRLRWYSPNAEFLVKEQAQIRGNNFTTELARSDSLSARTVRDRVMNAFTSITEGSAVERSRSIKPLYRILSHIEGNVRATGETILNELTEDPNSPSVKNKARRALRLLRKPGYQPFYSSGEDEGAKSTSAGRGELSGKSRLSPVRKARSQRSDTDGLVSKVEPATATAIAVLGLVLTTASLANDIASRNDPANLTLQKPSDGDQLGAAVPVGTKITVPHQLKAQAAGWWHAGIYGSTRTHDLKVEYVVAGETERTVSLIDNGNYEGEEDFTGFIHKQNLEGRCNDVDYVADAWVPWGSRSCYLRSAGHKMGEPKDVPIVLKGNLRSNVDLTVRSVWNFARGTDKNNDSDSRTITIPSSKDTYVFDEPEAGSAEFDRRSSTTAKVDLPAVQALPEVFRADQGSDFTLEAPLRESQRVPHYGFVYIPGTSQDVPERFLSEADARTRRGGALFVEEKSRNPKVESSGEVVDFDVPIQRQQPAPDASCQTLDAKAGMLIQGSQAVDVRDEAVPWTSYVSYGRKDEGEIGAGMEPTFVSTPLGVDFPFLEHPLPPGEIEVDEVEVSESGCDNQQTFRTISVSIANPGGETVTLYQGEQSWEITPLTPENLSGVSSGTTVEDYLEYSSSENRSEIDCDMGGTRTSLLAIYDGPEQGTDDRSLIIVHCGNQGADEEYNGESPFGDAKFVFSGEYVGDFNDYTVVRDDPNDNWGPNQTNWTWRATKTDGGAWRGWADQEDVIINIDPTFSGETHTWIAADGPEDENAIILDSSLVP